MLFPWISRCLLARSLAISGALASHSGGVVQGGFVTGWIDAAMARAAMCVTDFQQTPMSLEIKVSFFSPATPRILVAEAWIEGHAGLLTQLKK